MLSTHSFQIYMSLIISSPFSFNGLFLFLCANTKFYFNRAF